MAEKCKALTAEEFQNILIDVGIEKGDIILVHSDMMAIWTPPMPPDKLIPFYYEGLIKVIGEAGTLAVPAYFYEYSRFGEPYDTKKSPVSKPLGVFSAYIASLETAYRSLCPISAIAALGKKAEWICGGETAISYGYESPWHRLLSVNSKMVFLGAPVQSMTFVHYVEHQVGVPHLYSKLYSISVTRNGESVELPVVAQVPYLAYKIKYDLSRFEEDMESHGMIRSAKVGSGDLKVINMQQCFEFLAEKLRRNVFYLLEEPPAFVPGEIPTDGETGPR